MKLEGMFFEFRYTDARGESFSLSSSSEIISEEENYAAKYARKVISKCNKDGKKVSVYLKKGFPDDLKEQVGSCYSDNYEAYAVNILSDRIYIYGLSLCGLIYGVSTLAQLIESGNIREMLLFDYPDKNLRGYRVFTPGRSSFDAFKDMVDMLVYYKYNSLIIEVGGAMEYKRHPEINEEWVKYCEEVQKSPYESRRIQKETHTGWQKNSIHSANGGASYITQDEMREIIAYCEERGFSVIPEVPTLSHCDYIVRAHRELNERKEDTYPDTYCPSDPRTYELVFDILDEVAEVFKPEYINIGHDECYTLGKCEKCKGKDPVDLYVGDIIKINDYLKSKNIRTIMWGEKLFDNIYLPEKGVLRGFGGTGEPAWDVPRLFGCVGKIPRDVTILHWYWSLCTMEAEQDLLELGYRLIYGNFQAVRLTDYRKRSENIEGGFVSNWGAFEPEYMQRNGQNYNLTGTARIFWSGSYDTPDSKSEAKRS